ncbi:MAG: O-antigen polymerase [uncultured bacterium]|nr:MAG: O-antigen polymerase [uncultured bacterium]
MNIIRDNPITGTGPGTFSSIFPIYREKGLNAFINHAHNDYLEWISEIGVLAMPLILLFLGYLIMHGFMTSIGDSPFGITASTALIAISIHSFTDYNLRIPAIAIYLAVLLGFSFKFKQKKLLGPGRFI